MRVRSSEENCFFLVYKLLSSRRAIERGCSRGWQILGIEQNQRVRSYEENSFFPYISFSLAAEPHSVCHLQASNKQHVWTW